MSACTECGATHDDPCTYALCPRKSFKRTKRTADTIGNLRAASAQALPSTIDAACFSGVREMHPPVIVPNAANAVVLIDREDAERVLAMSWQVVEAKGQFRCFHMSKRGGAFYRIKLHRFIMQAPDGVLVDHINGNQLDNRRCNLRFASDQQNQRNRRVSRTNKSGFKGVAPTSSAKNPWQANIYVSRKQIYLGNFATPEAAALAYDEAARAHFGEFAAVNFPHAGERGARDRFSNHYDCEVASD